ncbi:MAG: hypothetical protein JWR18_3787, partial [Segetibacter sp.]|nr:hypothetical protein [Segetibacter sp.]
EQPARAAGNSLNKVMQVQVSDTTMSNRIPSAKYIKK